jgi:hypothetical protein
MNPTFANGWPACTPDEPGLWVSMLPFLQALDFA